MARVKKTNNKNPEKSAIRRDSVWRPKPPQPREPAPAQRAPVPPPNPAARILPDNEGDWNRARAAIKSPRFVLVPIPEAPGVAMVPASQAPGKKSSDSATTEFTRDWVDFIYRRAYQTPLNSEEEADKKSGAAEAKESEAPKEAPEAEESESSESTEGSETTEESAEATDLVPFPFVNPIVGMEVVVADR